VNPVSLLPSVEKISMAGGIVVLSLTNPAPVTIENV